MWYLVRSSVSEPVAAFETKDLALAALLSMATPLAFHVEFLAL